MRVHVSIPGTVKAYCVNESGEKQPATDELWLEAYLCGILRGYSYADDGSGDAIRRIVGLRRFNPVTNQETEDRMLHAAAELFFRGTYVSNQNKTCACVRACFLVASRRVGCQLISDQSLPSINISRLATWLRLGRAGTQRCVESPHVGPASLL